MGNSHKQANEHVQQNGRRKGVQDQKLIELYKSIWKERKQTSEVSGKKIYGEPKTIYFHHILPKSKYPQAKYDPENIILITGDEHATVEMNKYKYEEINKRREKLKIKYNV